MLIYLRRELHIINNLPVKILIRNNIIESKDIIINIVNKKIRINSYSITIKITTRPRGEFIWRKVYAKLSIFVSSHSEIILLIKEISLSNDRNFLFKLAVQTNLIMFAYLINYTITRILIRNKSNISIQISKKLRLKNVLEINYESYF